MSVVSAARAIAQRRKNSRSSREELEARQLARFRELVAFVVERSPYYARVIRQRGIDPARARPQDFPVLTKSLLMEHYDEIATDPRVTRRGLADFLAESRDPRNMFAGAFRVVHGSGTSGEICYIAYRRSEWLWAASQFERMVRVGWRKRVAFIGAAGGHFAGVSLATPIGPISGFLYNQRVFDVNRPLEDIVAELNCFQPRVLSGYGRVLRSLAERQREGELRIRPRLILNGGEAISPEDKRFIWTSFKAQVRNTYISTEHLNMAFGLPFSPGMYLLEDDLIFEIEPDHTLVTNLFNRTVPLIRHRMDDVLGPPPPDADTNGPYRIVGDIVGRQEQSPVFVNEEGKEDTLNPIVISELYIRGLKGFQFRLVDRTSFRFLTVPDKDAAPAEVERAAKARLDQLLKERRMANVSFTIETVDALSHDPKTGKFRLIVPAE